MAYKTINKNNRTVDVYDDGRIFQHAFTGADGRKWKGKFIKQANDQDGYKLVSIGSGQGFGAMFKVHRLVIEAFSESFNSSLQVDHINGEKSDNSLSNLRMSDSSSNGRAFRSKIKNTTSRFRGVYWNKKAKKWKSDIRKDGHKFFVGLFNSELDAAKAYNAKATELGFYPEALNQLS